MTQATFLQTVIIHDNGAPVQLDVYKHENGGLFAVDSSYIETEDKNYCPFTGKRIELNEG